MSDTVRVRMLMTVTFGENPTWPSGSVQHVSPDLARSMVESGEAIEEPRGGLDTTVARPIVDRVR